MCNTQKEPGADWEQNLFRATSFRGRQNLYANYLKFPILRFSIVDHEFFTEEQYLFYIPLQGCRINFAARYRNWALPSENI